MKKYQFIVVTSIFVTIGLSATLSCKKSDGNSSGRTYQPQVSTYGAGARDSVSITAEGEVTNRFGQSIKEQGFVWSASNRVPTIADHVVDCGNVFGVFDGLITGLSPHTTYWVSAFAEIGNVPGYGMPVEVTTP